LRILVTGAGGQLGRAAQDVFTRHEILARSHAELDASDLAALREALESTRAHCVLNAAGYTAVDAAEGDAEGAFAGNAIAPRHLAIATAERGIPLVHLSSDYVYDGRADRPYHEYDATHPVSVYGQSKLAGELEVRTFNPRHWIVRSAWLYSAVGRNFALTMRGLASRGEVRVVADQFGSPTYVPHLAAAIEQLIATAAYGTYHLVNAGVASWYEFARAIFRELGLKVDVRPIPTSAYPTAATRPPFSALTSVQQPRILLPAWQEGVREWAGVVG
jgi:dTDP-4-dehydrorhamnose reductase